jgi:hypothetical protein
MALMVASWAIVSYVRRIVCAFASDCFSFSRLVAIFLSTMRRGSTDSTTRHQRRQTRWVLDAIMKKENIEVMDRFSGCMPLLQ